MITCLKEPLQIEFYSEMSRVERWSVWTLRQKVQGILFERTAISKKPNDLIRRKWITIDHKDYSLDLLFYHRKLKRLMAIDLKLGKFKAEFKGQMELYLRWLEKYEMQKGEDLPIGLILCADKSEEHIQLLRLDDSGIRVARYLTQLPPKEVLRKKLQDAIMMARKQLDSRLDAKEDQEDEKWMSNERSA